MPVDPPVPPAGEEIHLPGSKKQPILLTVGLTIALVGVTVSLILVIFGGALMLGALFSWIADARREYAELPAEHSAH